MLISFEKGVTLPDHVHKYQPDLLHVIKGKATFFMDGVGEFPMEPEMVILVPPNTLHAIRRVEEEEVSLYIMFSHLGLNIPSEKRGNDKGRIFKVFN